MVSGIFGRSVTVLLIVGGMLSGCTHGTGSASEEDLSLRGRLELLEAAPDGRGDLALKAPAHELRRWYERFGFRSTWTRNRGLNGAGRGLWDRLRRLPRDGLDPNDYHRGAVEDRLRRLRTGEETRPPDRRSVLRTDLELLLTDALLRLGTHLLEGRFDPETLTVRNVAGDTDLVAYFAAARERGRLPAALRHLEPRTPDYDRLRDALRSLRRRVARGGWPSVGEGPPLTVGDTGERVRELHRRLEGGVGPAPKPVDPERFEAATAGAVRVFQRRHGLEDDGVVGPATLRALNVSARDRLRRILLNLERWRWLPRRVQSPHVQVNIADFSLEVHEEDRVALRMRVIVGEPFRQTPPLGDRIRYLVFHPTWTVPPQLAREDLLPRIRRDPGYLNRLGFRVYRGWAADAPEVDPSSVAWGRLSGETFPYRLVQRPGPSNALGRVKFMFPNRQNIYLHDTPNRDLFGSSRRDFSAGCIRVEDPRGLAAYLLRDHPEWPEDRIRKILERPAGEPRTVVLPEPVAIHVLYRTAWVTPDGTLHFRPDVYGRDEALASAWWGTGGGEGASGSAGNP